MPESRRNNRRPLQPWGEALLALSVAVVLGGIALGTVWTRIEEFERGEWDGAGIAQAVILGLVLIGLVTGLWAYLSRRVRD